MLTTSDRFVRYAVFAAAAGLYLLTLGFAILRLSNPSDGTQLWLRTQNPIPDAVAVTPLIEQTEGLQINDRITAVDGKPMDYWAAAIFNPVSTRPVWTFNETVMYTVVRGDQTLNVPVKLGMYPIGQLVSQNLGIVLFLITLQVGGGWIFVLHPDERTTQVLFLAASAVVTFSLCWLLGMDVAAFVNVNGLWLYYRGITVLMGTLMCSALLHFALLLPHLNTGRGVQRHLVQLIYAAPYLYHAFYLAITYTPNMLEWLRRWELSWWALFVVYVVLALVGIFSGYRTLADPLARRRVETVTVAYVLSAFLMIVLAWMPMWVTGQPWLGWHTFPLFALPVVLGVGIAVAFYHLFDIKIVIQRTLIWSALSAMVIVVYLGVVGILGLLFRLPNDPLFSLLATGIAAVLFQPLRERLQRNVTALLYGERDTPYEVVIRLTKKLEAALAPQTALDTIVQTICEALKLSYAAIELCQDDDYVTVAEYGGRGSVPAHEWISFPLHYGAESIGRLVVAPRASGETLTSADHRLITGLVHQAQVTIQTAQLTADLQRSREKLVNAREEERRRLRRDLHDGLGPTLASLTLQIDAARNLLNRDIPKADGLLLELKSQLRAAVADIRRLAYELRPPALDELGLVNALRERAQQFGQSGELTVTVDAPPLPPMPAAVEIAVYRIATEALTNAARHSHATACHVRLTLNDQLHLEVRDNGQGLPAKYKSGVGINSMQERAAELGGVCSVENALGGGTRVAASLPLRSFSSPEITLKGP